MRILYISPGLVPPPADPNYDMFHFLSEVAEGEILLPVWWKTIDEVEEFLKPTFPSYRVGTFRYHMCLLPAFSGLKVKAITFQFYLRTALRLHREKKFDAIMVYGTNTPGIAAVILKWLTGAKLITEIPGVPENAFRFDSPESNHPIKRFFADLLLNLVCGSSDLLKLLYPTQVAKYPRLNRKPSSVFHAFVPVKLLRPDKTTQRSIFSLGYPWYTKGMDILIEAFLRVAPEFPDWKLQLMGYFPDRKHLEELASGSPQIEFIQAAPRRIAFDRMEQCSVFALATRTESMGCVLLEAMAARKPIVASKVGGVPHYVTDDQNGLLFESENVEELASCLRRVMSDPQLRERLAANGFQRVSKELDEASFVREFGLMLTKVSQSSVRERGLGTNA